MSLSQMRNTLADLVRIAYLIGEWGATVTYFSNGYTVSLPVIIIATLIAGAFSVQNYLQQYQAKVALQQWRKHAADADSDHYRNDFFLHAGIVTALILAACFISTAYTFQTFHPGGDNAFMQQLARGLFIPVLYLLTIFMIEVDDDAAALVKRNNFRLYVEALKLTMHQNRKRFQAIKRTNKNANAIAIRLAEHVGDTESADGTRAIDEALSMVESGDTDHTVVLPDERMNHHRLAAPVAYFDLTQRQKQILVLYQQNNNISTTELAERVGCSQSTASTDLKRVKDWLQAHPGYTVWDAQPVSA